MANPDLLPLLLRWLKNDQEFVPDGKRVKAYANPDGTFGLLFESTEGDDKGSYTAVAVNPEGEARCTGQASHGKKYVDVDVGTTLFITLPYYILFPSRLLRLSTEKKWIFCCGIPHLKRVLQSIFQ